MGLRIAVGFRSHQTEGPRLNGPLADLNANSNSFVAPEPTEIFCVDLPSLSCQASIVQSPSGRLATRFEARHCKLIFEVT